MIDEFIDFLGKSTMNKVHFHFTDVANIPLIRQHGLLSMRQLRQQGIVVPAPGGNEWSLEADERCGMDQYVHLSFMPDHPMEYRARKEGRTMIWLRVDPDVLRLDGVRMTLDVSNKAGVQPLTPEIALNEIDAEVIYTRTDWNDPAIKSRLQAAKKYEILVPGHIPLQYLRFP